MNSKRQIGLHLRLNNTFSEIVQEAKDYGIKTFQCFLTKQDNGKYPKITHEDEEKFLKLRNKKSTNIYAHTSYWINLASGNKISSKASEDLLKKEIRVAKKLNIQYLVLHPGSATRFKSSDKDPLNKIAGIKSIAKILNRVLSKEDQIQILLENTAHGNKTIGSDITDFLLLKELLNEPEKTKFCIDFAHAFAHGYDLKKTDKFIDFLDQNMGLENIKLIHLNDSAEEKGSKIDKHEIPGKGLIGSKCLKKLINHPKLKKIPIILELPNGLNKQENTEILKEINTWQIQ